MNSLTRDRTLEYTYSRDILLSYADLETCKKLPDNLDPHVLRYVCMQCADTSIADAFALIYCSNCLLPSCM